MTPRLGPRRAPVFSLRTAPGLGNEVVTAGEHLCSPDGHVAYLISSGNGRRLLSFNAAETNGLLLEPRHLSLGAVKAMGCSLACACARPSCDAESGSSLP